jgi:hypothetical protein
MFDLKKYFNRRLTVREVLAVLVTIAAVAALAYACFNFISSKILEARVRAAIPRVCEEIRKERQTIIKAIGAYKEQFGVYPPDHVLSRQPVLVDPITNTLFYELSGVVYNPTNKSFELEGLESAEGEYVKHFFQCDGLTNSALKGHDVKHFLERGSVTPRQLHDDPDVFVLGFFMTDQSLRPEVRWEIDVGSWRYVSTSPTNNPGKFDLWIDVQTKNQKVTVGNWKSAE